MLYFQLSSWHLDIPIKHCLMFDILLGNLATRKRSNLIRIIIWQWTLLIQRCQPKKNQNPGDLQFYHFLTLKKVVQSTDQPIKSKKCMKFYQKIFPPKYQKSAKTWLKRYFMSFCSCCPEIWLTCAGEWEIQSVSGRLLDNTGELS